MVLQKNSTTHCWNDNQPAVRSVTDMLANLKPDSQSIMTIIREKSGACSVVIATDDSLGGTEIRHYYDEWPIILIKELAGLFLSESALLKGTNVSDPT